jgi:hypothetical protein
MKQTAVEWLIEQLKKNENIRWRGAPVSELTEQAKAMEKEQIIDAHLSGLLRPLEMEATKQAEQYYIEIYKNK